MWVDRSSLFSKYQIQMHEKFLLTWQENVNDPFSKWLHRVLNPRFWSQCFHWEKRAFGSAEVVSDSSSLSSSAFFVSMCKNKYELRCLSNTGTCCLYLPQFPRCAHLTEKCFYPSIEFCICRFLRYCWKGHTFILCAGWGVVMSVLFSSPMKWLQILERSWTKCELGVQNNGPPGLSSPQARWTL